MKLRDDLPDGCPPPDAEPIVEELRLYRLVAKWPPNAGDFFPNWELYSDLHEAYREEDKECEAKGLTVFTTPQAANMITKRRRHRGKKVCQVRILPGSGMVYQGETTHVTWWPCQTCFILAIGVECEI